MLVANISYSQQLIFSTKNGPIGRIAQRMTGDYYTHSAIVLNGYVYEQDWPRAKRTSLSEYGKRRTINDVYNISLSQGQVSAMQRYAETRMGERYRLKNYLFPRSRKTNGTWCSPFVGQVLNSGGYQLHSSQMHEPENLRQSLPLTFSHRYRK
jgi:hypothetical protein